MMNLKRLTLAILVICLLTLTACTSYVDNHVDTTSPMSTQTLEVGEGNTETIQVVETENAKPIEGRAYVVVDTGQNGCYDDEKGIPCPAEGKSYNGQDAQYTGVTPSYVDNGDGTTTDLNTGLMWQKTPDLENKSTYAEAVSGADGYRLAGYDDWRLPTIKELYSLIDFNGSSFAGIPYIDTDYFDFRFGDESKSERKIDAQYWSSTEYVGLTMRGDATVFGVNFADGRIKGYPRDTGPSGSPMEQFVRYVRGDTSYGVNDFTDNGDGTIADAATGLIWTKGDSGMTMNWEEALGYCETLEVAGSDNWRLPNAKELQSIVDYTHAPDAQDASLRGPALEPVFDLTEAESWFWTSTTHLDAPTPGNAVYVAFGQAFGVQGGNLINVHGAGAQRSDPKSGDAAQWEEGHGPQNDEIRIYNYARCVSGGVSDQIFVGGEGGESTSADSPLSGDETGSYDQPPVIQPGQPPQEAIDACTELSQGAVCTVNTPAGIIQGTCEVVGSTFACVPPGGPPGGGG